MLPTHRRVRWWWWRFWRRRPPIVGTIFVREPTDDGNGIVRTYAPSIRIHGDGFISPGDVDCKVVFPVDLRLSWRNEATAQTGTGVSGSYCAKTFLGTFANSKWTIPEGDIDLQLGMNRITITVSDSRGNSASVTLPVERLDDVVPPSILTRSPGPDAVDVPINRSVSVSFSEEMLQSSLTPARFVVIDSLGSEVTGSRSYDANNFIWTFTAQSFLVHSSPYTATIGSGVEDRYGGNTLSADSSWTFTTAANPDGTPPAVTRVSPAPATQCVAPDATIVAEFDEPLKSTSVNTATFLLVDDSGSQRSGGVDYDGVVATLLPDLPLSPATAYDATLTTGITDLAGNGLASDFTWSFSTSAELLGGAWTQTTTTNAPSERIGHTAVWTGAEMIVFGGHTFESGTFTDTNSGGRYDPVTNTWTQTSTANIGTFNTHSAVWTGNEMIVWGGGTTSGARYDPTQDRWQPMSTTDAPSPRSRHAGLWTGTELIVWGGESLGGTTIDTGGRYNPATDSWRPMSTTDAPSPRVGMAAVWTGSELVIWGGVASRVGGSYLTDGARYDPVSDTWTPLPATDAGSGTQVTGFWTGSEVLIWNGGMLGSLTSDGIALPHSTLRFFDPVANSWRATANACEPYLGASYYAEQAGTRFFFWANDPTWGGYFYDPATGSWEAITTTAAPLPRSYATSVWASDRFILWGGQEVLGGMQDTGFIFKE